jgi:hypothetical protein
VLKSLTRVWGLNGKNVFSGRWRCLTYRYPSLYVDHFSRIELVKYGTSRIDLVKTKRHSEIVIPEQTRMHGVIKGKINLSSGNQMTKHKPFSSNGTATGADNPYGGSKKECLHYFLSCLFAFTAANLCEAFVPATYP